MFPSLVSPQASQLCSSPFRSFNLGKQETNSIFHAYIGGLFVANGADTVNDWIDHLLLQENLNLKETYEEESLQSVEIPPQKRAKSETMSPLLQPTIFFASQPPPSPSPPRRELPPNLPVAPPIVLPNPLAPAQPGLPFLPLFNQAAAQRRVKVEYVPEFNGPSHAGRWTVQCVGEYMRIIKGSLIDNKMCSEWNMQRSWKWN